MIYIRFLTLPWSCHGFVKEDENGDYNVYINTRYCYLDQCKTLKHELEHIANGDLDDDTRTAKEIENGK